MNRKAFFPIAFLLMIYLSFLSCESKLYPPTDPPTLSNIVLTSDSYRSSTTTVREGDMVYVSVNVSDPENDPETLSVSVLSGGGEVRSNEVSASRIFEDTTWETWFDSAGLATGSYSISMSATDEAGNLSDSISKTFDIAADVSGTVVPADITVTLPAGPDNWTLRNTVTGEPFTVDFTVTNNFSLAIDILKIPINIQDSTTTVQHSGIAVVTSIDPAETKAGQLRLHIPDETDPNIVGGEAVADTANMEIVIY